MTDSSYLLNRIQVTLSSKEKKNPREQVLAIRDKEKDVADKPSIKFAIPVQAYVVPVPFPRRLRK